jgi:hypothetical protein
VTWANGLPTIICEECGHELHPELAVWYQGEVAVCRNADSCKTRQTHMGDAKAKFEELRRESKDAMTAEATHRDTFPVIEVEDRDPMKDQNKARKIVLDYYNDNYLPVGQELHISQIRIASFEKALQNWKARLSTDVPNDGMYFELTHNGDQGVTYLDAYVKASNVVIPF